MLERYIRQYSYNKLSEKFQRELLQKNVLVIGAGATGARSIDMMLRCGFGNITVFDNDVVELQNLQRQHIYTEADIGKKKAELLKEYAGTVNRDVTLNAADMYFDSDKAEELFKTKNFDAIVDATDNYKTRFLLNKIGVDKKIPVVFQALAGGEGFVFPFIPGKTCLSCFCNDGVAKSEELNAGNSGLFSPVCSLSTGLVVSLLFAIFSGEDVKSEYTSFDAWYPFRFKQFTVAKDPSCKVCGTCV